MRLVILAVLFLLVLMVIPSTKVSTASSPNSSAVYLDKQKYSILQTQGENQVYRSMQGSVEYKDVSVFDIYPGAVKWIILDEDLGHIVVGYDYIFINETKRVFYVEGIRYVVVGDLNLDNAPEIVVLTNQSLYALDKNLNPIWFAGVDYSYGFDRAIIANITSPEESLVVLWKYGSNVVAYYAANGTFLRVDTLTSSVTVEMLDVDFVGEYLLCKTRNQSYILAWRYGDTQAQIVYGFISSGLARINGSVYALGYRLSEARIVRFYVSNGALTFEESVIEDSSKLSLVIYGSDEILISDINCDNAHEFLTWNSTHILAVYSGVGSPIFKIAEIPSTEIIAPSCGWVFLLSNYTLYVYSSELVFRGSLTIKNSVGVLGREAIVYCSDGSAFKIIVDIDLRLEPIALWAGWTAIYANNQLVFYNGLLVSVAGEETWTIHIDYPVKSVFSDRNYVIVVLDNDTVLVLRDKQIIWRGTLNFDHKVIAGAFLENKDALVLVDDESNILYINSTGQYNFTLNLMGNITFVDINSDGDNYYILVGNWSNRVDIHLYKNSEEEYSYSYGFSNITSVSIKGQIFDGDSDGLQNVAYGVYIENDTKALVYMAALEGTALLWSQNSSSATDSQNKFNAFVAGEKYVYIANSTKFLIYPSLGTELNLNGTKTWASNGVFLTTEQSAILTTNGIVYLDYGGDLCWGNLGALTEALILNKYKLYKAIVGIDSSEPTGKFENLEDGSTINASSFTVSWSTTDDLAVANTTLFLDNDAVYTGKSNDTFTLRDLSEGEHKLSLRIVDIVGRLSWVNITITVNIPIDLQVGMSNDTIINTSSLNIPVVMIGNIDNVTIILNDTIYGLYEPFNGTINITFPKEGSWIVRFEATGYGDKVTIDYLVKVDLTPPRINFVWPKNNTIINTTRIPVSLNISAYAEDNFGVKEIYLYTNNMWISLSNEINLSLIFEEEGTYILRFKVVDFADFITNESLVLKINAIANFKVNFEYNSTWIRNNTIKFSWESRFIDYVEIYLENNFIGRVDPNGTMTMEIGDGVWTLKLLAVGFMDRILRSLMIKIDTKPPIISLIGVQNNSEIIVSPNERELEIGINISDNIGVENITIFINGTKVELEDGRIRFRVGEGLYILDIEARDYAGLEVKARFVIRVVYEGKGLSFLELIVIIASMVGGAGLGLYLIKRKLGASVEEVHRS